jgi:predicted permease
VAPVRDWLVGDRLTRLGTLLLGVVGVFLLMACASVSNLLLARASARLEEMGVRTALGAARRRIVGQLVTEGALLALVGGGLAVALAGPALGVVRALGPNDVARLAEATVDGSVLLVATAAAVGTVLLAGLAPSLLLIRRGVFTSLRSGTRSSSRSGRRVRDGLVVAQYALTVTVLLSAGLLTRSFLELQSVDLGFDPSGVVRFAVRLPNAAYDQGAREDFLLRLGAELEAIPGVEAVGATTASPFSRWRPSNFVARSDREPDRQEDFVPVSWRAVTGDYFAAAGIPLLAGRVFGPAELFPDGENPVGRLVTWFLPGGRQCEIVGVVASARDERMDALPRPRIYRPFTFSSWEEPSVLVRTAGDPAELVPAIRRAVSAVDPSVPTIAPAPIEDDVRASVAWPRFSMQVLVVFGLIALTLAAMGIYGVTAFSVARRRPEIGLRVALGAEPAELRWMVVRAALRLAVLGIAIGVAASFAVTGLMASILYDVSATDPATFLIVPGVLALVAIASSWLPARRALAVEPRSALVSE